jgi:hypothetical protein
MIIALAGRRVDAAEAKDQRFPIQNVELVRERISTLLQAEGAIALVGSAACGADLLAMLPFDRKKFRITSVIDRPGDWGAIYDKLLDEVVKSGDLLIIPAKSEDEAYTDVNHAIVDEALALRQSLGHPVIAVLVWDGKSRGEQDFTQEFGVYARIKGITVVEIMTS